MTTTGTDESDTEEVLPLVDHVDDDIEGLLNADYIVHDGVNDVGLHSDTDSDGEAVA